MHPPTRSHPVLEAACYAKGWAPAVVQALLLRYVEREPVPSRVALWLPPPLKSGLLQLLSSTLMAPVQYAYYLFTRCGRAPFPSLRFPLKPDAIARCDRTRNMRPVSDVENPSLSHKSTTHHRPH